MDAVKLIQTLVAVVVANVVLVLIMGGVLLRVLLPAGAQQTLLLEAGIDDFGAGCSLDRIVLIKPRGL